jgi:hypothetical protein
MATRVQRIFTADNTQRPAHEVVHHDPVTPRTYSLFPQDRLAADAGIKALSAELNALWVGALVNHRDLCVALAARQLARHWGLPVSVTSDPLPLVYRLSLADEFDDSMALTDEVTGAMRIENPMGWTRPLLSLVKALAQASGVEEANLRQRAAMFIVEWGGLETFGRSANEALEAHLRSLGMRTQYLKPQLG